jgi:predicted nuclease of predicted toxin-antitoxin system
LQGKISFLLDNDLSPDIATSLRLFEFDVIHHTDVPQFQNRTDIVEDPEIIQWCRDNGRTWITHDFEARRKHLAVMKAAHIHVVWIRGKTEPPERHSGETATWRLYKMLVRTIDELRRTLLNCRGAMHFRISTNVGTRPNVDWAESSHDRPKGR